METGEGGAFLMGLAFFFSDKQGILSSRFALYLLYADDDLQ